MRLVGSYIDDHNQQTIYTVRLDDGRYVKVKRLHFPDLHENPTTTVVDPPEDIDSMSIIAYLREDYRLEFSMPSLIYRSRYGYADIRQTCYSTEQALYLAQTRWDETKDKSDWLYFYISIGDTIIKDFVNDYDIGIRRHCHTGLSAAI